MGQEKFAGQKPAFYHCATQPTIKLGKTKTNLDIVALADDSDIALEVTFRSAVDVVWIGEQCPLVIELVIYARPPTTSHRSNETRQYRIVSYRTVYSYKTVDNSQHQTMHQNNKK